MKKYLIKISSFILLLIVFWGVLLAVSPDNKVIYLYAHHNKMVSLDSISSPKIVLAGGSNLAFGLDTKTIADSLHANVFNAATHAGIGLRFILDDVARRLNPGDTVIIMPEYQQFASTYNGTNETLTAAVMYSTPGALNLLNRQQLAIFLSGLPLYIKNNFLAKDDGKEWRYSALNFNEYGDESAHWNEPGVELKPYTAGGALDEYAVDDFARKVRGLRDRGIGVILWWPITIETNLNRNLKLVGMIESGLASRGLQFDNAPECFVQPDSLAFDTPYHMSYPAVKDGTQRFIRAFKRMREL